MRKWILVADDSAPIRKLVRLFLDSKPGLKVCGEAADGVEAVEKAQELQPDLIVMDLSMPRMNGFQAAAILHKTMPRVPIILFTLYKEKVSEDQVQESGIACVLSKTDELHRLFVEVHRLVHTV